MALVGFNAAGFGLAIFAVPLKSGPRVARFAVCSVEEVVFLANALPVAGGAWCNVFDFFCGALCNGLALPVAGICWCCGFEFVCGALSNGLALSVVGGSGFYGFEFVC